METLDYKLLNHHRTRVIVTWTQVDSSHLGTWNNLWFDSTCPRKKDLGLMSDLSVGNTSVCTKCHDSPSNSCQDIQPKTQNINFMVALEEGSGEYSSTERTLYKSFQHFET